MLASRNRMLVPDGKRHGENAVIKDARSFGETVGAVLVVLLTTLAVVAAAASAAEPAPNTTITSGPSGTTTDNTPTFEFTSSQSPARFECSVDGGAFSACSSPFTTSPRSDGNHTFAVRAIDAANNVDPTPATRSFTVTTPPPPPPPPPAAAFSSQPSSPPATPPATVTASSIRAPAVQSPARRVAIAPSPVVRILGSYSTRGVRLRLFAVTAPAGVKITVRCRGRGCPYRQRGPFVVRKAGTRPAGSARYVSIRGFRGRRLKPGARLEVLVTHPRQIGKYTSFTIRRGRPPLRKDSCLRPGGSVASCG